MTAAEAYRKTTDARKGQSEYDEDHADIMSDIEGACSDGEYDVDFDDDEFDDIERHMEDLKSDGFRVTRREGVHNVSWKHAGQDSNE